MPRKKREKGKGTKTGEGKEIRWKRKKLFSSRKKNFPFGNT